MINKIILIYKFKFSSYYLIIIDIRMDSTTVCSTPEDGRKEESPSVSRTPLRTPSSCSKGLMTPCRQVGLRKRSLKSFTSPVISNSDKTIGKPLENHKKFKPQEEEVRSTCTKNILSPTSVVITNSTKSRKLKKSNWGLPVVPDTSTDAKECLMKNETMTLPSKSQITSLEKNVRLPITNEGTLPSGCSDSAVENRDGDSSCSEESLHTLRQRIKEKEKEVKSLRLIQLYRKKHDVNKLAALTARWRTGCQAALQRLLEVTNNRGHSLSMAELLTQLGIPPDLVKYNTSSEDFE